jgi:ketosteroid isomerase-like protein
MAVGEEQPTSALTSTAADIEAVRAVVAMEVAAATAANPDFSYVTDDVVVMPPGQPAVVGLDAMMAWFQEFTSQMTIVSIDYTVSEVTVAGNWAFEHYAGTMTVEPVGGGDQMTEVVKGIHIFRRQIDGAWKMSHDVWNSDAPPPAG